MDYTYTFAISAAGMTLERTRVDIAALNLANAHTIQTPGGVNYQPLRVVARATTDAALGGQTLPFGEMVSQELGESILTNAQAFVSIEPASNSARLVYDPGHPMANEKGFLTYPGVDPATEMVTLMSAMRTYEANVAAMNTARTMAIKTLEIGG